MAEQFDYVTPLQILGEINRYDFSSTFGQWTINTYSDSSSLKIGFFISSNQHKAYDFKIQGKFISPTNSTQFLNALPSTAAQLYSCVALFNDKASFNQFQRYNIVIKIERAYAENSILSHLSNILATSQFADVTIKTSDGKEIKASKLILSRSPVFNAMLSRQDTKEAQTVIEINDVPHEVMTEMIYFMYTDQVPKLDNMALELMIAANKYEIRKLLEVSKNYLKTHISLHTLTDILFYADGLKIDDLVDEIIKFIAKNDKDVFESKMWALFEENNLQLAMKVMKHCYESLKDEQKAKRPRL